MTKYSEATPGGTPLSGDVMGITRDPGGTPLDRSVRPDDIGVFVGAQTLVMANKTMNAAKVNTSPNINWSGAVTLQTSTVADAQPITLTGAVTLTDGMTDGESVLLHIDDGTGDFSITWPTMTWFSDNGQAPILQNSGFTQIVIYKVGITLFGIAMNGA